VRVIGLSYQGNIGLESRTLQTQRPCHQVKLSRNRRTQQDLPFVIRPSSTTTASSSMALGLDHFEDRSYARWHRHVTLAVLAQAFCTKLRTDPKAHAPG
jgi:dipeptidase